MTYLTSKSEGELGVRDLLLFTRQEGAATVTLWTETPNA